MSILGSIFSRILGRDRQQQQPQSAPQARPAPAPQAQPAPARPTAPQAGAQATVSAGAPAGQAPQQPQQQPVDVEAVLTQKEREKDQDLNWRTSIVDLMKLLDIDSSLQNRKELADELGYTGDKSDSAAMNIWLHRQVMNALARNGGIVPASMRD